MKNRPAYATNKISFAIVALLTVITGCQSFKKGINSENLGSVKIPGIEFSPEHYFCPRAGKVTIDGEISPSEWAGAEWTRYFTDIEGELKPDPLYTTRAKMMWDDSCLYIAAEIYEPHIWGRLKERDTIIYHDNDFEVFIDPEGDTRDYYELEINSLNTAWDLQLSRPYRDRGRVNNDWNINGLKSSVKIQGTLNDPSDVDSLWVIEIAIPFSSMNTSENPPMDGNTWRLNFSRVNWKLDHPEGVYVKSKDPGTGKNLPEYNWVWSPQGVINMHYPEMWGYLTFIDDKADTASRFNTDEENIKWLLRRLYYAERNYAAENGRFTANINKLVPGENNKTLTGVSVKLTEHGFHAKAPIGISGVSFYITQYGELVKKGIDEKI